MDAQKFRRLGDIALAIGENPLDVLPFHTRQAGYRSQPSGACRRGRPPGLESKQELVGIDGLGEIVIRSAPDRFERRGNAAITCEHQDKCCGVKLPEPTYYVDAGFGDEAQIHNCEVRAFLARGRDGIRGVGGAECFPSPSFECTAES